MYPQCACVHVCMCAIVHSVGICACMHVCPLYLLCEHFWAGSNTNNAKGFQNTDTLFKRGNMWVVVCEGRLVLSDHSLLAILQSFMHSFCMFYACLCMIIGHIYWFCLCMIIMHDCWSCLCMFIHVYACLCNDHHACFLVTFIGLVYACLCMFMHVSAMITMYDYYA